MLVCHLLLTTVPQLIQELDKIRDIRDKHMRCCGVSGQNHERQANLLTARARIVHTRNRDVDSITQQIERLQQELAANAQSKSVTASP